MKQICTVPIILALTACGGGGGGTGGVGGITGGGAGGFSVATLNSQLNTADPGETVASAMTTGAGVAGVIATAEAIGTQAGLQSIKLRTSADYQTVFVSINGGPEFSLAASFPSDSGGGGYGPTGLGANYVSTSNLADYSLVGRVEGTSGGFGYAGLATDPSALPANLTYTGNWSGFLNPNTVSTSPTSGGGSGSMTLTLDVASNDVDGSFSGDLTVGSGTSVSNYPISGVVDTTLSGSVFSGTMTANTGSYQGTSDLGGLFFGQTAGTAAGAFGGSLTGPSGTHAFYGTFNLN